MNVKNEVLIRLYGVLVVFLILACVILFKTFTIVQIEGDRWRSLGQKTHVKRMPILGSRGNILSNDGSFLATSMPFFEIRFDLNSDALSDEVFMNNIDSLSYLLVKHIDKSYTIGGMKDRLLTEREKGNRYLLIGKDISFDKLQILKKFPIFNLGKYKGGFIVIKKPQRKRPFGILANRTVGYVKENSNDKNDTTKVGIEGAYDKILTGKEGKRLMQKVRGGWIPVNDLLEVKPESGSDVKTTIDIDLQDIAHNALLRGLQNHNASEGTAIVMDVRTGAIRAMANIESYNGNWWERYNHAIGTSFEPGSTFKIASLMALLEDNLVKLDDKISVEHGKTKFFNLNMVDATMATKNLDSMTLRHAIEVSSNVGISKLVNEKYKDNPIKFIDKLKQFNLHLPTGIDILGEPLPILKSPAEDNQWSGITLPWMSMGYEVSLTPLQMLNFYNTIANDGIAMKPFLVQQIEKNGEITKVMKPAIINNRIASKRTIKQVKSVLRGVITNGTGSKLADTPYEFAGKSGTAQINYMTLNKGKEKLKYRASFVGFFPFDNPVYSCIVVVTNPTQNGFYGSQVAGPIFREITDKIYALKPNLRKPINKTPRPRLKTKNLPTKLVGYNKDFRKIVEQIGLPVKKAASTEMTTIKAKNDALWMLNHKTERGKVPDIVGMGLRDALYLLENLGLKVKFSGYGKVKKQSIQPGIDAHGQTIYIQLL